MPTLVEAAMAADPAGDERFDDRHVGEELVLRELHLRRAPWPVPPVSSPERVDCRVYTHAVYRSRASCFPAPSDAPPSSTVRHVPSRRPASPTRPWRTSPPRAASPSSSSTATSSRRRSSTGRSSSRSSTGWARSCAPSWRSHRGSGLGPRTLLRVAREDPAAFTLLWRHAAREPQFAAYAAELRSVSVAVVRDLTSLDTGDELLDAWRSDVLFGWLVEATLTWLQRGEPARDDDFVQQTSAGFRALRTSLTAGAQTRGPAAVERT